MTDVDRPRVDEERGFVVTRREEVLRVSRPGTEWLSTGANGGFSTGPAAYNVSVPEGWGKHDIEKYASERRRAVGFEDEGPTLLTGVSMDHARVARAEPATVVATAGVSNPAVFGDGTGTTEGADASGSDHRAQENDPVGTVNVIACVERDLPAGARANLVAVVAEAKATALLAETGFPGTTTDAVVVGTAPGAPQATFSGSATRVGAATRCCVYDAVRASLRSRYAEEDPPASVEVAEHGVVTERETELSRPRSPKGQADRPPSDS